MKQQTIQSGFTLKGKGLHTGVLITAQFSPADENSGIQICRRDLPGKPTYEALANYVSATERGTVLENGSWRVSTVEHMLSAFYALGIDNCNVSVDGPEIPILDGSAKPFVEAIEKVGIVEQRAEAKVLVIDKQVEYTSENGSKLFIVPNDKLSLDVTIEFPSSQFLDKQQAVLDDLSGFSQDIASARTFCFVRDIEPLLSRGLIKGGDLDNALVIYETPMSQSGLDRMCDRLGQEHWDATKLGYLSPLNYHNEPARHKLLDLLGDLSLIGCRLQGRVYATRPGHTFNTQCAKQLKNKFIQPLITSVHTMSYIHPHATIDPSVTIGPYCYIDDDVVIGAGTVLEPHVTIYAGTTIGQNCHIFPNAVVGGVPQDLKFVGEKTTTVIGDNNIIRECVTIHRGTASKGTTVIGNNNLIMSYCHVAHDCVVHDHIIMSNCVQLAGEVVVDDYAIIGGGTLVHQFSHIGKHVMVQGGSRINKDIVPYAMVGRDPIAYCGINSVGLRRRGFTNAQINTIQDIYRVIYLSGLNTSQALAKVLKDLPASEERDEIALFITSSTRGICGRGRGKVQ